MDPCVQISEVLFKVCRIVPPCQTIDAWCSPFLQVEEGPAQDVDADVMQKRSQLLLLVPVYSFTYAVLRL
jgi:hypothetical protein